MTDQELLHLLALQKVDGVGDIVAKKLLVNCGSAEEVFKSKSSKLAAIDGIGTVLLKNLKDKSIFEKAEKELKFIQENNINYAYFQDENYP
jgi:DNA processing protein